MPQLDSKSIDQEGLEHEPELLLSGRRRNRRCDRIEIGCVPEPIRSDDPVALNVPSAHQDVDQRYLGAGYPARIRGTRSRLLFCRRRRSQTYDLQS